MHRFGLLLIGLGALMALGKGGLLFLPLFFFAPLLIWPLLAMLLFRGFAFGPGRPGPWGYGRHGRYGWRGHHGHYGHDRGCGERREQPEAGGGEERRGYTGDTIRL